jgi:hypothetical protein
MIGVIGITSDGSGTAEKSIDARRRRRWLSAGGSGGVSGAGLGS